MLTGFQCCQIFNLNSPCYLHSHLNNHYYTREFFPCREHSCNVVLVLLPKRFLSPVCCVPKPYLHCSLCPSSAEWAFSTTADSDFPSLNSQPDSNGIDWREPEPENHCSSTVPKGVRASCCPALFSLRLPI